MADPYNAQHVAGSRRTRVVVLSLIAVGLLVFAAVGVWMSPGGNKGQELGKGLGGVESGERGEISTTGAITSSRDMRDGRMRQAGDPARTSLEIADTIDSAVVSGRIERIPHAEAMYSWGLTNHDRDQLFDRPVYLKVDGVRPAQPAASAY